MRFATGSGGASLARAAAPKRGPGPAGVALASGGGPLSYTWRLPGLRLRLRAVAPSPDAVVAYQWTVVLAP